MVELLLQERVKVYIAVINSASSANLSKDEVPKIADTIWEAILKPLGIKMEGNPQSALPSSKRRP